MMQLYNFQMVDANQGDLYSSPRHYFEFLRDCQVINLDCPTFRLGDILSRLPGDPSSRVAILGGGGLLGPTAYSDKLDLILEAFEYVIGWGVGTADQLDWRPVYLSQGPLRYVPAHMERMTLCGIRDYGQKWDYVPCASCLHSSFDKPVDPIHELVVFQHVNHKLPIYGYPLLENHAVDFQTVINFLASGQYVVTNSYHGVYWSQLLGRKVVAFPFASKFYGFKHIPPLVTLGNWKVGLKSATVIPGFLEECRALNRAFAQRVRAWLVQRGQDLFKEQGSEIAVDHPTAEREADAGHG